MGLGDKSRRKPEYLPDPESERFLADLNDRLAEVPPLATPELPVLFSGGSPRSGTTVLAQAITRYFDVAYVDNLAARFWRAPVTGLKLSGAVFPGERRSDGRSRYGRTAGLDIHGFHYFWLTQLGIETSADLFTAPEDRGVELAPIIGHLAAMERAASRPLHLIGHYPLYYMAAFCRRLPTAVFVFIERAPVEQCLSILEARATVMRDIGDWWSMPSPGHERLAGLAPAVQVAAQVTGLKRHFEAQAKAAGGDLRLVRLAYEDLVADPAGTMRRIGDEVRAATGFALVERGELPEIRAAEKRYPDDWRADVEMALADVAAAEG